MDWLTFVAKIVLPHGYWGSSQTAGQEDRHLHLTFDDGPHPDTTPALLDLLDEESAKATFFVLGKKIHRYPGLVAEIVKRGHTVGNHSFSHSIMPMMTTKRIESEIADTNDLIKEETGQEPVLFRPPFGLMDDRASWLLQERLMTTVYWGAVSEDWMGIGEKRVIGRTMQRLSHGALIVLHEGKSIAKQTLVATREIIQQSRSHGYSFRALP
jgi:peptidoglycan/xylan/chitin deacetylase (PgdA/CDA1 family)